MNVISMGDFGATKKAVAKAPAVDKTTAKRLQAALVTLGKVTGSATLKAIVVDGAIGAKTVAGVNWAFTNHIGSGQAPANLRTGKLDLAFVKANAATLAGLIETEITRRGATAASPATVAKAAAIQAVKAAPPVSAATAKASAKRLQAALVNLGKVTGSAKLAVAVDGAIGPKTVAAVNWAFTQHIGAGQAAAQYRTGQLALAYIKTNAETLALLLEAEIKRRGGSAAVAKAATATAPAAVSKTAAKALQTALYSLGKVAGSARLQIAVDGAIGPKTVDAVNWAFTQHVGAGQAPAQFRTGKLTLNDVKANAGTLTSLLTTEVQRRGGSLVTPTTAKKKVAAVSKSIQVKTKDGKTVTATKVATAAGETYKVTDPATGEEYYTPDPTTATPPKKPAGLPAATEEQEAEAAEASAEAAAQGQKLVTTGVQFEPGGGTSFFSEYKWPILGGVGALALIGIGVMVLKRRPGGGGGSAPEARLSVTTANTKDGESMIFANSGMGAVADVVADAKAKYTQSLVTIGSKTATPAQKVQATVDLITATKILDQMGTTLPAPPPPPAPALKTASIVPAIVPAVALSFFEEHATALKIGGGIALAGLVGYAVIRQRSRR